MAWTKIPPENHPIFHAALPKDPRIETLKMFGGVAAKVNGNMFAGLFGLSTMVLLNDADRARALALKGASMFDPMGDGRARSDKVMLPVSVMSNPAELHRWLVRALEAGTALPSKATKKPSTKKPAPATTASKATASKKSPPRRSSPKKAAARTSKKVTG